MPEIVKNTEAKRFEYRTDGQVVGYVDYTVDAGVVILPHTFVEPAHRGGSIAGDVVRYALDDIRAEGYRVDPACPYVATWIERHPDYADLVVTREGQDTDQVVDDAARVTGVDLDADPRV
ncbi:GNAT family N-acetyltransferase [Propioniciclava soli]|uniref:GNAT family N-acetyltransferase n=1 Tax=Propioniciclava soli TaxID=2775081 RepID=UPI001E3283EE|nr:GNAT family N-acetyltransferase [Propioniciclava soli]